MKTIIIGKWSELTFNAKYGDKIIIDKNGNKTLEEVLCSMLISLEFGASYHLIVCKHNFYKFVFADALDTENRNGIWY